MNNKTITVLGLGAGDIEQLPLGIYRALQTDQPLYLRTKEHPVVTALAAEGMTFTSFDEVYESSAQFHDVYETIVARLFAAVQHEDIVYAVPGHPLVAEKTVQLLLEGSEAAGCKVEIAGGQSFIDPMLASLQIDPIEGFQLVDGTDLQANSVDMTQHVMIAQVYDAFVASEVKLALMEKYPDDYEVLIMTAAGSAEEVKKWVPLYELDRVAEINNLTTVYVPPVKDEALRYREFSKLREVIAELRGPNGCPWDKKQTHQSLKKYLIEESYEVLEAIDEENDDALADELGDVLLQVMLHAQIGEDEGYFSIDDVIYALTAKMIRRHPHVFGDGTAKDADEVVANWDAIKQQEKESKAERASLLDGIPAGIPGLYRAYELQKKAAKIGFDWDQPAPIWEKVHEELAEFQSEINDEASNLNMAQEFGDLIFALVNLARYYSIDPEDALRMTNTKFTKRFQYIEAVAAQNQKSLTEMSLAEMDVLWEEAKSKGL